MNISDLIKQGVWEKFYMNKAGDKFPFTPENTKTYLNMSESKDWSLVYQPKIELEKEQK